MFSTERKVGPLFLVVLALITALLPLSMHLFFPALPSVMADFSSSEAMVNLTVSVPLFVMALMSLVYGFLSDKFGRRPVLLCSIGFFVLGSVLSAMATDMWMLICGRFLQAAGGGGGLGLARVIARDVFGADRLVKVLSYLTMAYAIGPMVSGPLGGAVADLGGWRAVLIVASVLGILIGLISFFVIFETNKNVADGSRGQTPFEDYRRLFTNPRFVAFILQSGFTSSVFFTMAAASSFLMIDYLGRSPSEYGLYFICFPFGFLVGSLLSAYVAGRVKVETMVLLGSIVMVVGTLTQAGFLLSGIVTPLTIFLPGFFAISAQGIALPNAQSGAINVAGPLAGSAAGIGVFIQLLAAALATQVYGIIADGTPVPMAIAVSICALLGLAVGSIPFLLSARDARKC